MAGTQKVGAHQHDTTCAGIWACCVRQTNTTARNCTGCRAPLYLPLWPVTNIQFAHLSWKRNSFCGWSLLLKPCACGKHSSVVNASELLLLYPTYYICLLPLGQRRYPSFNLMVDDDLVQSKHVNCFSLPPLVSRSSTRISQLISQIVQKRQKSGLRAGHSEVFTSRHVVWTDSIPIEPNQRKTYKLASLLSGCG